MMNSRLSFTLALCLGVLVFSHADADHHKKKHKDSGSNSDSSSQSTDEKQTIVPSSPSDETLNTGRFKPATSLGVHHTPSGEQVCPKGSTGTPPNCSPLTQEGKKVILF
jgi:hypothetical protein